MVYCKNCGAQIDEKAVICPHCGVSQQTINDSGSIGYGILGFLMPMVGLIIFLIWKDSKPKSAKSAGIGALTLVSLVLIGSIALAILGAMVS